MADARDEKCIKCVSDLELGAAVAGVRDGLRGCEQVLDANNGSGISKEEWLIPWKFGWERVGVANRKTEEGRVKLSV